MGVSDFIARRYYSFKSNWNIVNIISRSASFVLIVAVCAFFVVLSVFSGLKVFGSNYSKAFDPDIKIVSKESKHFYLEESISEQLKKISNISFFSAVLEDKVLVKNNENSGFAYLNGVEKQYSSVFEIEKIITLGGWLTSMTENQVVVSHSLADNLSLGLYNYGGGLTLLVPSKKDENNILQNPFSSSFFMVSGIFGSSEANDQKNIFIPLTSAQILLGLDKREVSSVAIKLIDNDKSKSTIKKIQEVFGNTFSVKSREELNETYYKMLNAEGLILNLVLGLILVVAMFNTVGAVIILIIEKEKDIKTLYKIGANRAQVSSVFFRHGLYLSFSGGLVGLVLGCLIVFIQEQFGIISLSGTLIPYPVVFEISNFGIVIGWMVLVGTGGALLSLLALKKVKL
ncbi:MAG: hypothetical protein CMC38_01555 [Flavobacteriaceae bacterium]|nr:hypothetical protein [Flavobacteriaceae bacterium]